MDGIMPRVETKIKIGDFTLVAYAFRTLTEAERRAAVRMYLQQFRLKKVPTSGTAKVYTLFGLDPMSGL